MPFTVTVFKMDGASMSSRAKDERVAGSLVWRVRGWDGRWVGG